MNIFTVSISAARFWIYSFSKAFNIGLVIDSGRRGVSSEGKVFSVVSVSVGVAGGPCWMGVSIVENKLALFVSI